jgi:hypothetical protein
VGGINVQRVVGLNSHDITRFKRLWTSPMVACNAATEPYAPVLNIIKEHRCNQRDSTQKEIS